MPFKKTGKCRKAAVRRIYAFPFYQPRKDVVELIFTGQCAPVILRGTGIQLAVAFL